MIFLNSSQLKIQKLYVFPTLPKGDQLIWNRSKPIMQFSASGYLNSENGTFVYWPINHKNLMLVFKLSKTGRVRIEKTKTMGSDPDILES
jgi:hypothetical protein